MTRNLSITFLFLINYIFHGSLFTQIDSTHIKEIETEIDCSFRALSVVNDNVVWLAGSSGTIGLSVDGGLTWSFKIVKGKEDQDFRSIYAFNQSTAIIVNAGSPGFILRTEDGGNSWKTVFQDEREKVFMDGIDFWNETEGIVYGDPIDGRMYLLRTYDAGNTWKEIYSEARPIMEEGEASFAASGTGIRCLGNDAALISTGGMKSRLFLTTNQGNDWFPIEVPITQGTVSKGIYSIAWGKTGKVVLVGGDYKEMDMAEKHVLLSGENLETWNSPDTPTRGYRECVEFIDENTLLAVGPTGIDISKNAGNSWEVFSDIKGFHVIRKARKGDLIIMAGAKGQISVITFE